MKIEVLSGLRLLLKLTNLYNKNGVYIGSVHIRDFYVFSMISLPPIFYTLLIIWDVIEEEFDLQSTSNSLATVIAVLQVTIAYISLAMKTDSMKSTVDDLQELVDQSK